MAKVYRFLGKFGSNGSGDGQFSFPQNPSDSTPTAGLAVDANYIYVADKGNNRIQIFNNSAPFDYVTQFGSPGSGDGQFNAPVDIVVDASHIYVLEDGNNRIQKFVIGSYTYDSKVALPGEIYKALHHDATDLYVLSVGADNYYRKYTKSGLLLISGPNSFLASGSPYDIAVDATYTYVANHNVAVKPSRQIFGNNTAYTNIGDAFSTKGITIDSNYIYITETTRVAAYDISTLAFTDFFGAYGSGDGSFDGVTRIEYYNNKIYVMDNGNHRIQVFDWYYTNAPSTPTDLTAACAGGGTIQLDWVDNS